MRFWYIGLAMTAAAALAACAPEPPRDPRQLHRGNGPDINSFDPHQAIGTWSRQILGDMFEGLYVLNAAGEPVLGAAETVVVSDDGLTWTFTLRRALWSDSREVTADDFVWSLRRALSMEPATPTAVMLSVIEGAQDFAADPRQTNVLGVEAINRDTLVIRLAHRVDHLPDILAQSAAAPVPRWVEQVSGAEWTQPGNIAVNGPYTLFSWEPGERAVLVRNSRHRDSEALCFHTVIYETTPDDTAALARIIAGELDMHAGYAPADRDRILEEIPQFRREYAGFGSIFLTPNTQFAPLDDVRVRRAIALAVDTDDIAGALFPGVADPAGRLTPPALSQGPAVRTDYADLTITQRRALALELLGAAGFNTGRPLRFVLSAPASGSGPALAERIREQLEAMAPWIQIRVAAVDDATHYADLAAGAFQMALDSWLPDHANPLSLLANFASTAGPANHSAWSSPEADQLITAARRTNSAAERGQLVSELERILLDLAVVTPVLHTRNRALVSPEITGWEPNPERIHPSRYLCREGQQTGPLRLRP